MTTGAERRRSERIPAEAQVLQVESEGQTNITLGSTRDVSIHGMYVQVRKQFNPAQDPRERTALFLRFKLPQTEQTLETAARIARVDHDEVGRVTGFGVEFVEMSESCREIIEGFVAARA